MNRRKKKSGKAQWQERPLTTLTAPSASLCTFLLNPGEKWFSDKGYSLREHPWVLPCLSKASADVKKTDRSSLSRRFYATALVIYLVAVMATAGDA